MLSCRGTERSHREPERASTIDAAAIRSAIHEICPRRFWPMGPSLHFSEQICLQKSIVFIVAWYLAYNNESRFHQRS